MMEQGGVKLAVGIVVVISRKAERRKECPGSTIGCATVLANREDKMVTRKPPSNSTYSDDND